MTQKMKNPAICKIRIKYSAKFHQEIKHKIKVRKEREEEVYRSKRSSVIGKRSGYKSFVFVVFEKPYWDLPKIIYSVRANIDQLAMKSFNLHETTSIFFLK